MLQKLLYKRTLILLSLFLIVPLGLFSKAYVGIGQEWIRNYSGDVLYEIFWCLFIFWFVRCSKNALRSTRCFRIASRLTTICADALSVRLIALRNTAIKIALGVFVVTCAIEVSQLWFYLVPVKIRSTFVWRILLGAGFDWWDFPHYALGSLIGGWIIYQIDRLSVISKEIL